ncbi:sigma-70 family RNA polymerase sigma factor [Dactylosporangium sp. NPDC000244]|uniref:sigma-70 family RNA polymerase sigma factor n=1 Tax=Dactylosporangium sp. NPDC000244 TaxID=3154365 RepID=UPI0033321973
MELSVTMSCRGDETLLELCGVLDYASVPYLRHVVYRRFDAGAHTITLDAAALRLIDAASIKVLLYLRERALGAGGDLRLTDVRGTAVAALEIAGVAKELDAYGEAGWPDEDRASTPVDLGAVHLGHGHWPVGATEMLQRLSSLSLADPRRARLRDEVIELCLPAARHLARRYAGSGEPLGDLAQVAAMGLVKAVDGYDPQRAVEFGAYASPTVTGELKRHFRDHIGAVRLPRRLQELRVQLSRARDELTLTLGRPPRPEDLAAHLDAGVDEIAECVAAGHLQRPISFDSPATVSGEREDTTVADLVGGDDPGFELADLRASLPVAMAGLPERERRIVALRFYGNLSQSEIAARVGISQMHVSRLLTHALGFLRRRLA